MTTDPITQTRERMATGFTLIEVLFYTGLFALLFAVITQTLLAIGGGTSEIRTISNINKSGTNAMERITRDVREAQFVDEQSSSFGTSSGTLTVSLNSDGSETRSFYESNNRLVVDVNGTREGILTSQNIDVSRFGVHYIENDPTEAVRVTLEVTATSTEQTRTVMFHNTIVLRQSSMD